VCNHCREFDAVTRRQWFPDEEGQRRLQSMIETLRESGRGRRYDCILGLSGGVDSSYLALKCRDWGLRPLAVHVDAGWNSEVAVSNIEKILDYCGFDLHTEVVDWEEMRDLQLAYLHSGIPNQDVPQDHVFFASLYHLAIRHGIRHVLSGGNIATEGIFPSAWHGSAMDAINLHAIHRRHGQQPLRRYRTIGFFQFYLWYPFVKQMRVLRPLNYLPYVKSTAMEDLERRVGWQPYGRKHGESLFTRIFQNYYLPARFGYDKRRPHYSSLIVSGQMRREEALVLLAEPLYDPVELEIDLDYLCKKLRINRAEFDALMATPLRRHTDYRTWQPAFRLLKCGHSFLKMLTGRSYNVYS
jgi:N-acetyl sugar amidotransferase